MNYSAFFNCFSEIKAWSGFMKPLVMALLLSSVALGGLDAQTQQDEFNREAQYYETLAVKLYPDCAVADSPLLSLMIKMDTVLKAKQSQIYYLSSKPIIEAAAAACLLKIQPHWEAVTEGEKNTAYDMMTIGLISSQDLKSPRVAQSQPPAQQPFNPGSMNDDPLANKPAPQVGAVSSDTNLKPTRNGYLYFYNDLRNRSGDLWGRKGLPAAYTKGPFSGMTEGEGKAYAQQQWASLSPDQQVACEQKANIYGPGPDPDAPSESHTYNFQPNGMGGGTISGH